MQRTIVSNIRPIASAKEFELTDADYEEFKNKVKGAVSSMTNKVRRF